jgi:acyl-coenzyme A synthetase/AMP-(fatty) acid ligase
MSRAGAVIDGLPAGERDAVRDELQAALAAWCRERLAGFQVPKAFEAAEAIPRTGSGKILRRSLS